MNNPKIPVPFSGTAALMSAGNLAGLFGKVSLFELKSYDSKTKPPTPVEVLIKTCSKKKNDK